MRRRGTYNKEYEVNELSIQARKREHTNSIITKTKAQERHRMDSYTLDADVAVTASWSEGGLSDVLGNQSSTCSKRLKGTVALNYYDNWTPREKCTCYLSKSLCAI